MKDILKKIYTNNFAQAVDYILNLYEKQWFVVSNFIYFAIIKEQKLFKSTKKTTIQKEYYKAIMKWDLLLPDGIALQTFYYFAKRQFNLPVKKLSNLNWTDFVPYFLDDMKKDMVVKEFVYFYTEQNPILLNQSKTILFINDLMSFICKMVIQKWIGINL